MRRNQVFLIITAFLAFFLFLSRPNRPLDVDITQIALFFGAYFYDVPSDSRVDGLKYSREEGKIAVSVRYKEKDTLKYKYAVMNPDGTGRELISAERFPEFTKSAKSELNRKTEKRLKEFTDKKFKPHTGILGGIVNYEVVSWLYSPDKSRIAFIIVGDDGHSDFYPSLYVADNKGNNITRIDSTAEDMCQDIVWLTGNEIFYVKDSSLWKAVIR